MLDGPLFKVKPEKKHLACVWEYSLQANASRFDLAVGNTLKLRTDVTTGKFKSPFSLTIALKLEN